MKRIKIVIIYTSKNRPTNITLLSKGIKIKENIKKHMGISQMVLQTFSSWKWCTSHPRYRRAGRARLSFATDNEKATSGREGNEHLSPVRVEQPAKDLEKTTGT